MLKISELKQHLSIETLFPDFYFLSAKDGWLCKICTSFSQGHSGSRTFIDKPGNLIDHPTEIFTDHLKSIRHLTSVENNQCYNEVSKRNTNIWQLTTNATLANASDA